jgi:dsDNA-specific endonuclease/ATPase MutS2
MARRFAIGDAVQTALGKGIVRAVRNSGRVLVDIAGQPVVISEAEISPLEARKSKAASAASRPSAPAEPRPPHRQSTRDGVSVDLHGLTVNEALDRAERAFNEALLADGDELRFIHGRSGGRIRAALHQRLRQIPSVRGFALDPRNEGVTIVRL